MITLYRNLGRIMLTFLQLLSHTSFCCFPWNTRTWVWTPGEGYVLLFWNSISTGAPVVRGQVSGFFCPPIIIPVIIKPAVGQGLEHCNWKDGAATVRWRKHLLASRVTISHNLSEPCELVMQPLYWSTTSGQRLFTLRFHSSVHVLEKCVLMCRVCLLQHE